MGLVSGSSVTSLRTRKFALLKVSLSRSRVLKLPNVKPDKIEDFMIETAILLVCLALSRKAYPTFVKHFGEMK